MVKEEISDDNAKLPCFNGRVVSWVSKLTHIYTCGWTVVNVSHLISLACVSLTSECNCALRLDVGGNGLLKAAQV